MTTSLAEVDEALQQPGGADRRGGQQRRQLPLGPAGAASGGTVESDEEVKEPEDVQVPPGHVVLRWTFI